jgi:hypothetical protein
MKRKRLAKPKRLSIFDVKTVRGQGTKRFPLRTPVLVTKGPLRGRSGVIAGHETRLGRVTGLLVSFGRNHIGVAKSSELSKI